MSAFVLVFVILTCIVGLFGGDARAYARKRLAARKARTSLLPERQQQLAVAEWLDVFRETVVAAEGEISPDLDAFLTGATARDRILVDAERIHDKMLDGVLRHSDEAFAAMLYDELRLKWHLSGFALLVRWKYCDEKRREMWTTIAAAVRVILKRQHDAKEQETGGALARSQGEEK